MVFEILHKCSAIEHELMGMAHIEKWAYLLSCRELDEKSSLESAQETISLTWRIPIPFLLVTSWSAYLVQSLLPGWSLPRYVISFTST